MVATVLLCCLFCGCSNNSLTDISPITNKFSCNFSVADSDLSGQLSVNAEGDLSLVFGGPDIINGIGIRVKEESVIIEVDGVSERYARSEVPTDSPALLIYDALTVAKNFSPTADGDRIVLIGKGDSGGFSLTLDGYGYITEMNFDISDASITLTEHTEN